MPIYQRLRNAELLPKTDPAKIILDETLQTVGLAAGMKLDLGLWQKDILLIC